MDASAALWMPGVEGMHTRRSVLCRAASFAAACVVAPISVIRADDELLLARSAEAAETARVEIVVEAAGTLKFNDKGASKSLPTAVTARLSYDEKRLDDED